jgi:dTDP-4-amino-4,6-dideoxygalactose transaminase
MFKWPIVTKEDEEAVLAVLRRGAMSGTEVTQEFERKFAEWQGSKYALGFNNGTQALQAAMFACGVGAGDEIIVPSLTYWASALPCFSLGATPVFADVEADSLCLDAKDAESRITERTKAIVVVHYMGHPADMDPIMEMARRRRIKVIEDVSHAQGGLYKGRRLGTIGDVGAMSLMSGKSFAIGEAGILTTDDLGILEHAIALGHYERFDGRIQDPALRNFAGLPLGGYKNRMHQLSSAMGLVQLKHYDARCVEIRKAMNYFWDLLDGVPGLRAHRVDEKKTGSTMAGWYAARGHYVPEELGGLSVTRFVEAIRAEGFGAAAGCNKPLHSHAMFSAAEVPGPAGTARKLRPLGTRKGGRLPVAERAGERSYSIPWFKHYQPAVIQDYANAFRKVALQADRLRKDDKGNPASLGGWHFVSHK